ncbi:MAG: TolC family protein [Deltaproteobacteria bacterium]|nr:TolC family protein [Deltaproteobacteria bacterium]
MFSVQQTLDLQPNIKIAEQEVVSKSASLQESDGRFDLTINSSFGYHESFMPLSRAQKATTGQSSRDEGVGDFTLSFNQELANGIVLQPSLSITRTDDQSFGTDTINDASVNFNLIVPLQKGWGRDVVEAGIRSAQVSVQSSRFSLQHTTAVSIKEMVSAYWNYVAAEKKLTILKNIEDRTRQAVADMQEMVKADESPASELGPLNANLSDKSLSRVAAEQNLVASRHGLGMAIGLTRIDSGSLSRPLDYFPEAINFVADDEVKRVQIVSFATLAKNMRTDLKSLSSNEEALRITLVSARNDLKPQLDLVFSTGYNGLTEGDNWKKSINSLSSRVPGLNYGVALNYQFPYQNNSAKGRLAQIEAALVQARISTSDLERNIVSQVEVVFSALQRSLEELQYSAESVKVYRQVVSDERDKIHLGMGTVIDLVTMVDKLESALLAEVTSQQNYANILLDLRYETGTLISWGEDGSSSLNIKNLIALPDIDRSGL